MIKELQIRPFARPLFIWIVGIVLQSFCCVYDYSFYLLFLPFLVLFLSVLFIKRENSFCYDGRWLWGSIFFTFLLFLSIQKTKIQQVDLLKSPSKSYMYQYSEKIQKCLLEPFNNLNLTDQEKQVLAAITFGYRKGMNKRVQKQFSVTGVAHLLAVSGFHVAIVYSFLSFLSSLFFRKEWGKWIQYIFIVLCLWFFVLITGFTASAIRAVLMLTLYLTGHQMGKLIERYNILIASAFCMLVYNPLYLFDIGFQLSYLAVVSILYFQPRLQSFMKIRNPLFRTPWKWITVTLSAQLGTVFLCLYYWGNFPTVFLFVNLPLTFLATLLIPVGLLWITLSILLSPCEELENVVELLTRSMFDVVEIFSQVPGCTYTFHFDFWMMSVAYGMGIIGLLFIKTKRIKYLFMALLLLLVFLLVRLIDGFAV